MDQPRGPEQKRHVWRLRDRIFVVLTANIAVLCVWATEYVSQEIVLEYNAARGLLMIMLPSGFEPPPAATSPQASSASDDPFDPAEANPFADPARLAQQVAAVEVIAYVWRRVMWGVAGLLEMVALLAVIARRSRVLQLVAAAVILLSTVATLVAMRLLIDPDYGGMADLPIRWHVMVAVAQSAYGVVLLAAFARKPTWVRAQPG